MHTRLILLLGLAVLPVRVAGGEPAPAVSCGPAGVEAVVSLQYPERTHGAVTGVFLDVTYTAPLAIPGAGTAPEVRQRVTPLTGSDVRLVPADDDAAGRLRLLATAPGEKGVPPGEVARVRFDCAAGTPVPTGALRCSTDQVADDAGQMMAAKLAKDVTCSVTTLSPASAR